MYTENCACQRIIGLNRGFLFQGDLILLKIPLKHQWTHWLPRWNNVHRTSHAGNTYTHQANTIGLTAVVVLCRSAQPSRSKETLGSIKQLIWLWLHTKHPCQAKTKYSAIREITNHAKRFSMTWTNIYDNSNYAGIWASMMNPMIRTIHVQQWTAPLSVTHNEK